MGVTMYSPLNQVLNPTDGQRLEMLKNSLDNVGRQADYEYIVKYLSPPPDITNYASIEELKGVKIGIVGGGLAGLSAAFELRKLGADITILDASKDRIGGRVYTYYFDPLGKYYGEFGAMRIPVSHQTTWHYINLFGLNTIPMTPKQRNNFLYVHNIRLRSSESVQQYLYPAYDLTMQERMTPWPELSSYAFNHRFLQLSPEVRSELIRILPEYSPEFYPLMNMSLRRNFEELGLSQGVIELISGVDPASGALLNMSYDEIAHEEYSLDYSNTYRIEGGNVYLPYALYQSFLSAAPPQYGDIPQSKLGKVSYKSGYFVTGIYQSDYRNKIIIKYNNHSGLDTADIFDYVISAIPFSALRTVEVKPYFSNRKMQAILDLNYIDAQKTLFLCNRRFWERNTDYGNIFGGISFTDLPIEAIIYIRDYLNNPEDSHEFSEDPGVLVASYGLVQNATRLGGLTEARRLEVVRQNVEEVHGLPKGFLNSMITKYKTVHWNEEPYYTGALANTLPSQKPLYSFNMLQPEYNGKVYFAGEHVSSKHGWMQGALYSGMVAANSIADHFHNQSRC
jgi:monoamine oxidase